MGRGRAAGGASGSPTGNSAVPCCAPWGAGRASLSPVAGSEKQVWSGASSAGGDRPCPCAVSLTRFLALRAYGVGGSKNPGICL